MISIKIIAFFLKIWEKVMLVVTMATGVAIKIFTIIFLVLSGIDHSVKVHPILRWALERPYGNFLVFSENWC